MFTLLGILRLGDDLNCQYGIVFALSFAVANGYLHRGLSHDVH